MDASRIRKKKFAFSQISGYVWTTGEGKKRKEFAEWNVERRAEWHNYAKYELRNDIIMRDTIYA